MAISKLIENPVIPPAHFLTCNETLSNRILAMAFKIAACSLS